MHLRLLLASLLAPRASLNDHQSAMRRSDWLHMQVTAVRSQQRNSVWAHPHSRAADRARGKRRVRERDRRRQRRASSGAEAAAASWAAVIARGKIGLGENDSSGRPSTGKSSNTCM
eukprot:scaffold1857_cov247-Pinguiococcus_pyrenoidosus.AAC.8